MCQAAARRNPGCDETMSAGRRDEMMARIEVGAVQRRRLPVFIRIAAGLVIGLLIAAIIGAIGSMAWLKGAMRQQMPVLDGNLQLPGLSAPVLVRRDVHGIPHIQAATMDDLLEAQGFVVAQDRLWQMDMARRFAAGELAELLGPSVVEHDKVQRVLQIRPAAEHLTATMPEDQKRLFEAFARGVNAFISSHQDNLPAEFRLLGYKPRPWQPVDSWLVALNMVARLDTLYPWKLEREKVRSQARAQPDGRVISHHHLARSSAYAVDSRPDGSPAEYSGSPARRVANQPRRPVAAASNSQVGVGWMRRLQARLQ